MTWYDITLEGFTVHTQTWDHAWNVDGWADEIYIHTDARVIDQAGTMLIASTTQTPIMGDTNTFRHRVRAGSATSRGGLRSGDEFPYSNPWVRQAGLQATHPPMRLWQGELADDRAVAITPTIWEWDGGTDMFNTWGQSFVTNGPAIAQAVAKIIAMAKGVPVPGDLIKSGLELGLPPLFALGSAILGQAKDHPIGLVKEGDRFAYTTQSLVLTGKRAELATQTDFGKGPGVIALNYRDDAELGGASYSLYLKVEKRQTGLREGMLVREHSSAPVYVIFGGAKFWLPDPTWLGRYSPRQWADVVVVPDGALAAVPAVPQDGTVLREWSNAAVFVVLNRQKCWIRTFELLDKYTEGQRWSRVRVVPDGALAAIPDGPHAP
jgi:hypothetical protein